VKAKGKDVDLYCASHVQDTSNAYFVTETEPPGRLGHRPWPSNTGLRSDPTTGRRQRQPAVGLHLRNPSLMDYYSFNRPRRDGWLSWPCWLTDSRRFTRKVVTRPAVSLAQDRESSPAKTGGLTTMLRHQLCANWKKLSSRRETARCSVSFENVLRLRLYNDISVKLSYSSSRSATVTVKRYVSSTTALFSVRSNPRWRLGIGIGGSNGTISSGTKFK